MCCSVLQCVAVFCSMSCTKSQILVMFPTCRRVGVCVCVCVRVCVREKATKSVCERERERECVCGRVRESA